MKSEHRVLCATAKSRANLILQIEALAAELNLAFVARHTPLSLRSMSFSLQHGPYCVSGNFDGASRVGSFLGHWHIEGKGGETFPACFANVNPYHRTKATTCVDRFDDFIDCLRRSFVVLKGESP